MFFSFDSAAIQHVHKPRDVILEDMFMYIIFCTVRQI